MKKILIILFSGLFSTYMMAINYKGWIDVENKSFKEINDTLFLSLDISVESNALKNCQSLLITPVLETPTQFRNLPHVRIDGANRNRAIKRWKKTKGKKKQYETPVTEIVLKQNQNHLVQYHIQVPYEMWMDTAKLVLKEELLDCAGEIRLYTYNLGKKVELAERISYEESPVVNFQTPPAEKKTRKMQGKAFLDFQVGKSVILPDFRNNPEELAKIHTTIEKVKNDPDVVIDGFLIEGYASPEGSYQLNVKLSNARAMALKNYIQNRYGFEESMFKVTSVAEDWEGLRKMVEASNISRKEQVLSLIDSPQYGYDEKERKLKALGYPYGVIQHEMFPQLRRVEYQIDYTVREYSFEESVNLLDINPEKLSHLELYTIADSYGRGTPAFNDLIRLIALHYPDDPVAAVNMAAVALQHNELNEAKKYLDKAGNSPYAYNNWGVYYLKTGELDRAEAMFGKAKENGYEQAEHNLNEVNLKRENTRKMERYADRKF